MWVVWRCLLPFHLPLSSLPLALLVSPCSVQGQRPGPRRNHSVVRVKESVLHLQICDPGHHNSNLSLRVLTRHLSKMDVNDVDDELAVGERGRRNGAADDANNDNEIDEVDDIEEDDEEDEDDEEEDDPHQPDNDAPENDNINPDIIEGGVAEVDEPGKKASEADIVSD